MLEITITDFASNKQE